MGADLHIHVFHRNELTQEDFLDFFSTTMGSKWFDMSKTISSDRSRDLFRKMSETKNIWVGSVSWLKAAIFDDGEKYIPQTVEKVAEIIGEDLPVIDDDLIHKISEAFDLPNNTGYYEVADKNAVIEFLEKNRGCMVFTISW